MLTRKSLAGYWLYKEVLYIVNNDRTYFDYDDYVANKPSVHYSSYCFENLRVLTSKGSGRCPRMHKILRNGQQISCFISNSKEA